ncbi:hypothetical protein [Pseudodesulfovibrio nedwellii]|uniref:hypothetical protein n=1 Tax=Pseudodesulfovibrio nedwellii TaxID=2973072 RepID=UPI00249323D2|nr:hypothetical protein [Pseudodesulfovibrio nedwellii]
MAVRYESPLQWSLAMPVLFLLIVSSAVEMQVKQVPKFVIWGILLVAIGSMIVSPSDALYTIFVGTGVGVMFSIIYFVIACRAGKVVPEFGILLVGTAAVISCFAESRLIVMTLIMCVAYGMVVFFTAKWNRGNKMPASAILGIGCLVMMMWA